MARLKFTILLLLTATCVSCLTKQTQEISRAPQVHSASAVRVTDELRGLLYLTFESSVPGSSEEIFAVMLMQPDGSTRKFGSITIGKTFFLARSGYFQGKIYFINPSGGISTHDLRSGITSDTHIKITNAEEKGSHPVFDFLITDEGVLVALHGTCTHEDEPYVCELYAHSLQDGESEFLKAIPRPDLWGVVELLPEVSSDDTIIYEVRSEGTTEYYAFDWRRQEQIKVGEQECSYEGCRVSEGEIPQITGLPFSTCHGIPLSFIEDIKLSNFIIACLPS